MLLLQLLQLGISLPLLLLSLLQIPLPLLQQAVMLGLLPCSFPGRGQLLLGQCQLCSEASQLPLQSGDASLCCPGGCLCSGHLCNQALCLCLCLPLGCLDSDQLCRQVVFLCCSILSGVLHARQLAQLAGVPRHPHSLCTRKTALLIGHCATQTSTCQGRDS